MALRGGTPVDFGAGQILLVRGDEPAMAERVGDAADSIAIELIGHGACELGARGDRAAETVDAVSKEVRRMAEAGPTQQELDEAKSYLQGSQMLALDTSSKLASAMLQYELDGLGIDYIEKRNSYVEAVTLDQAREAAKRLWSRGLVTVVVGRAPEAAAQPASAEPPAAN